MRLLRSSLPMVLVLAGCAVTVAPVTPSGTAKVRAKAPARGVPAASSRPAGATTPEKPTAAPTADAAAAVEKLAFPTRILPPMPEAIGLIAAGGGNLIGADAGSLIGPDGASLIGADGASLAGGPGQPYQLAQLLLTPTPGPTPTCRPEPAPTRPAFMMGILVKSYMDAVRDTEKILENAATLALTPGVPETDTYRTPDFKTLSHTLLLERRGEGGLLRYADGPTMDPARVVTALAFSSPRAGRVVQRLSNPEMQGLEMVLSTTFDLDKETAESDLVMKFAFMGMPGTVTHSHYQMARSQAAGAPAFRFMAASYQSSMASPCGPKRSAILSHFDAENRAALLMALVREKDGPMVYARPDGTTMPAPGPEAAFFLDEKGQDMPASAASDALKGLLPKEGDFPEAMLPAISLEDPMSDPSVKMPE